MRLRAGSWCLRAQHGARMMQLVRVLPRASPVRFEPRCPTTPLAGARACARRRRRCCRRRCCRHRCALALRAARPADLPLVARRRRAACRRAACRRAACRRAAGGGRRRISRVTAARCSGEDVCSRPTTAPLVQEILRALCQHALPLQQLVARHSTKARHQLTRARDEALCADLHTEGRVVDRRVKTTRNSATP